MRESQVQLRCFGRRLCGLDGCRGAREVVLHQVRVAVSPDHVPDDASERRAFCERLVTLAEIWARQCFNERHAELTEL